MIRDDVCWWWTLSLIWEGENVDEVGKMRMTIRREEDGEDDGRLKMKTINR